MELDQFLSKLDGVRHLPSGTSARCPAHDDHVASLMVNGGEHGGIVLKCHAGCATEDVVRAMGLSMSDLAGLPHVVETYDYTDENGTWLYSVQRWANPKTFKVVPGLPPPAQRVLYQMPAIAWARREGKTVFVVEGERDVNTLAALSIPATCNVGGAGAGKWLPHYSQAFAGLDVVVVADNDAPGKLHARVVATSLKGIARSVTPMHSPHGKDITDLIKGGYSIDSLALLPEVDDMGVFVASSILSKAVFWAWTDYFPLAKLSLIEGDPGDGKSVLTIDLAARWSTGAPMPDGTNGVGPWDVAMISAEDDPEDTLRPRLERAGANLDRIHLIPHGVSPDVPFDLSTDIKWLTGYIVAKGIRVLFIDPLSAFMSEKTDTHNDASTRRALQPLKVLATLTGAAVICVRHLAKSGTGKAIYRGIGSVAFAGAARAGYLVVPKHDDPNVRVLACVKNNLARKPPSLTFTVEIADKQPYLVWGDPLAMDAQALLDGPDNPDREDDLAGRRRERESYRTYLLDLLANGPLPWTEIKAHGKEDGFNEIGLRRARSDVGLIKVFASHGNAGVVWAAPEPVTDSDGQTLTCSFAQEGSGAVRQSDVEQMSKRASADHSPYPDGSTDEERDAWLDELPAVCSICQTTDGVNAYGKPWWVWRCRSHSPLTYGDGL